MIDLHAHILPGLDDGAKNFDEALMMLQQAADDGITTVVATPHAHHSQGVDIHAAVHALNGEARWAGIAVKVLPGSEVRIASSMVERHRASELVTINASRYLLLELTLHDDWPVHQLLRVIDTLLAEGLIPVLAHAERYRFVERDPAQLRPLVERGIPIQINARSLLYRQEDPERITAERLLHFGYAHLLASDAHNAGYRPPRMRDAFDRARTLVGNAWVDRAHSIATAIIADRAIGALCPVEAQSPRSRDRG